MKTEKSSLDLIWLAEATRAGILRSLGPVDVWPGRFRVVGCPCALQGV